MNLATIPAGVDFLGTLADEVRKDSAQTATPISDYMILLPTRRAVRTLTQLFFPGGNAAALMPRIHALGDLDDDVLTLTSPDLELPPAIHPMARLGLLINLIQSQEAMPWARALALAKALATLLDESILRDVPLLQLDSLVTGELAKHWEKSLLWLRVISEQWPEILSRRGQIDAADLRQRILQSYAALWREQPPTHPIIAAGSTGSLPATRALLRVIAGLPRGQVILPALDTNMPDEIWNSLPENHPQNALHNLLNALEISRDKIHIIGAPPGPHAALWHEVLLPPAATARWRAPERRLIKSEQDCAMLKNLHTCTAPSGEVEANVITLILARAMTENKTAALVTPDRALAQRVAAKLHRFGITANDSAGQNLAQSPAGRWVRLLLQCALSGNPAAELFYLLRHPFSCFGTTRALCREATRQMERDYFHRAQSPVHLENLLAMPNANLPLKDCLEKLLHAPTSATLADWVSWLRGMAENLTTPPDEPPMLLQDDAGEAMAELFAQLELNSDSFSRMQADDFTEFMTAELEAVTLHPPSTHPNLHILGPLESRLHAFDVVVLGGLNEGTWPAEMSPDPWLSLQMRKDIALGLPDERIGLAAHDFLQLASQPCVYLTRAEMSGGAPALPSRWWQRLSAYLKACGVPENLIEDFAWLAKADGLDRAANFAPAARPAPAPLNRPRRYSPSGIKMLIQNPYQFYAQKILQLRDLPELLAEPVEADQGTVFHALLAEFTREYPVTMPRNAKEILDARARQSLLLPGLSAMQQEFWWQNYSTARDNFLVWQEAALAAGRRVVKEAIETDISYPLMTAAGEIMLHARADRIDVDAHGQWVIVDYKRNNAPNPTDILSLQEPQLVMEGWLLSHAPIAGHPPRTVAGAEIWPLLGDAPVIPDAAKFQTAIASFAEIIKPFFEHYLAPQNPFAARIIKQPFDNEALYQQLSRAAEWQGQKNMDAA